MAAYKTIIWWTLIFAHLYNYVCGDDTRVKYVGPQKKPNIIIIMADDMGFNDASIHSSNQIPTPNIDALATMGITLNRMYSAPMCSPSRSALMTGKYESNTGMQHFVIASDQPFGLDPKEKTMAQYMKKAGYGTYLVGKWHLGFYRKKYTPLFRGFDSHFGYLGPYIDYFNHSLKQVGVPFDMASGYDMRKNFTTYWDSIGQYATDLFTEKAVETIENHDKNKPLFMLLTHLAPHAASEENPLQAPESEVSKFRYIKDENRRTYAAMISKLDEGVGKVVKALESEGMLENSIVLFLSDNGAPIQGQFSNSGSNYPFKGQKDSPWEGAVRSMSAIWSPMLKNRERVSNQLIHISDWLPTLARMAGIKITDHIDGKNIWNALSYNLPSPRTEILCHYDAKAPYKAYISGNYKYVSGSTYNGTYDKYLSAPNEISEENVAFRDNYAESVLASDAGKALSKYALTIEHEEINEIRKKAKVTCNGHSPPHENSSEYCDPIKSPCLFDIIDDPCETTNLAAQLPQMMAEIEEKVEYYGKIAKPIRNKPHDERANPAHFGGIWTWWFDELEISTNSGRTVLAEQAISMLCAFVLVLYFV